MRTGLYVKISILLYKFETTGIYQNFLVRIHNQHSD